MVQTTQEQNFKDRPLTEGYTIDKLESTIYRVALSPNRRYVATGDNNKRILIWELGSQQEQQTGKRKHKKAKLLDLLERGFHRGIVRSLAWSSDGRRLASGGSGNILIWDIDFDLSSHQSPTLKLRDHTDRVTSLLWISDVRLLSGSKDTEIICWNPKSGENLFQFNNKNQPITCMAISPCKTYIAVGSNDGNVRLYNWMTQEPVGEPIGGHRDRINSLAWSSNKVIATASEDKTIKLWNVSDFNNIVCKGSLEEHTRGVLAVSFSPKGEVLASQSSDMTLRFWDVERSKPVNFYEWECSAHPNTGMSFDPYESVLVSMGSKDHVFRTWKVSIETMLDMYKRRSDSDNMEYNRLESALVRVKDGNSDLHNSLYNSVQEPGYDPEICSSYSFSTFRSRAEAKDFLVAVYRNVDDLFGCREEIELFLRNQKECYLFISEAVVGDSGYTESSKSFFNSLDESCHIQYFSDDHELSSKIVSVLRERFQSKRERIDKIQPKTDLVNRNKPEEKDHKGGLNTRSTESLDFAIFTAIETERLALCEAFGISDTDRIHAGPYTYWKKQFPLPNGRYYSLAVAQSADAANVDAALIGASTINTFHPKAILMVGIAAATSAEQSLGDIVLGRYIYYYERGKIVRDATLPEPITHHPDATLWNRVTNVPKSSFEIKAQRPDGEDRPPSIYPGVIACGEKVVDDETFRNMLVTEHHRKIQAIEMEGYGFSAAARQQSEPVRCLVIRALSDYADGKKNKVWQKYAAAAAAGFTKHFLSDVPLQPQE